MDILVDTHAAIWFITDDKKLPRFSKKIIKDPQNQCFVSIATLWEMGIKYSLEKLKLKAEGQLSPKSKGRLRPRSKCLRSKVSTLDFRLHDLRPQDFIPQK